MLRAAGFVEAKFHGWTGYRTSNCTAGALLTAWKASMSSDEPTTGTTNPRRRILWLVVAHVVVGLIGALVAYFAGRDPTLRGAAFVGIVFSQTSLLGIWGGLGTKSVVEQS